jgi:hypothetical protein
MKRNFRRLVLSIGSTLLFAYVVGVGFASGNREDARSGQRETGSLLLSAPQPDARDAVHRARRFQYVDRSTGLAFQGTVETAPKGNGVPSSRVQEFSGEYHPCSAGDAAGGRFYLVLYHNDPLGPSKDDYCEIHLSGGAYDGYSSFGTWRVGD